MSNQSANCDTPKAIPRPAEGGEAWFIACPRCGAEADIDNHWLPLAANRETLCCHCGGRYIIVLPEATDEGH